MALGTAEPASDLRGSWCPPRFYGYFHLSATRSRCWHETCPRGERSRAPLGPHRRAIVRIGQQSARPDQHIGRIEAPDMSATGVRTGVSYLESLRDGRSVFLDGERVRSAADHPAFRNAARSIAGLYDCVAAAENRRTMTYASPSTGAPVSVAFLQPRTPADLVTRRDALKALADSTYGLMGRSPEHFAGFLVGFSLRPDLFAEDDPRFGRNIVRYYEHARDNDLYISYVLVPPQIDRSRPAHQQEDPTLYAGVVDERADGIVVSGAQMLGTGAPLSNEVFLSCILPLRAGDENYAISLAVPAATPGLRMLVRRSYATNATSVYDYPLSSRFDETDALLVFDRVFVPWERVFVYK